jgi:hypothetical protein
MRDKRWWWGISNDTADVSDLLPGCRSLLILLLTPARSGVGCFKAFLDQVVCGDLIGKLLISEVTMNHMHACGIFGKQVTWTRRGIDIAVFELVVRLS